VSRRGTGVGVLVAIICALVPASARAASYWTPPQQLTWYWQLKGTPSVEPVQATDMDGFDNSAATVAAFHARGQRVICYIDVGTWENWRPDASSFPSTVLGSGNGWPGESWLDVRQLSVLEPIMAARFQMCQQKGFDAVEPDNMDGYGNSTGFPITAAQQLDYDTWIAQEVHSLGMAVFEKNDPDQAGQLEPYFDGVIDEQCNQYSGCSSYQPYLRADKPVLNAEYESSLYPSFCSADEAAGIMGAMYATALNGSAYTPCFGPSPPSPPISVTRPVSSPGHGKTSAPIRIRSVRATAGGIVEIRLTCPHGRARCHGTLDVLGQLPGARSHRHPRLSALGRARFRIAAGRSKVVSVRLRPSARNRLSAKRTIRAVIEVTSRDGGGRVSIVRRTMKLGVPSAKKNVIAFDSARERPSSRTRVGGARRLRAGCGLQGQAAAAWTGSNSGLAAPSAHISAET